MKLFVHVNYFDEDPAVRSGYNEHCPFYRPEWGIDGNEQAYGWCLAKGHALETGCPRRGPRGGVKNDAPDDCPLRKGPVIVEAR